MYFSKKMLNEKNRGIKRQGGSTCTPPPKHVAASQASALGTQKLEPPWPGALAT